MKIEHVLFPSVLFKMTDPFDERSFLMCSHDPFFGTNKNRNLKNGSCEQAFRQTVQLIPGKLLHAVTSCLLKER